MSKMNITLWGSFQISKLFDIHPTKAYKLTNNNLFEENGQNPVIVNSSYNNGVGGYTKLPTTENGQMITFSDTTSADAIFYQDKPFVGYPHVQGLYAIGEYKNCWSKYSLLFFLSVFKWKAKCLNFDYVNKFTRDLAKSMMVKLPIDKTGNPDFLYMESYMKNQEAIVSTSLNKLRLAKQDLKNVKIDISKWKDFNIGYLFEIRKGTRLVKADMKEGKHPFIGASAANNGITAMISNNEHLHRGNTITISYNGSVGEAFYQANEFWASDDVNVLYPKFSMNKYVAMFIIPILKNAGQKYAFINKWKKDDMEKDLIKLPVDDFGNPDYAYMTNYMAMLKSKIENNMRLLNIVQS